MQKSQGCLLSFTEGKQRDSTIKCSIELLLHVLPYLTWLIFFFSINTTATLPVKLGTHGKLIFLTTHFTHYDTYIQSFTHTMTLLANAYCTHIRN